MASEARQGAPAVPSEDADGEISKMTPYRAPAGEFKDQDMPDVPTPTNTATVPTRLPSPEADNVAESFDIPTSGFYELRQ